MKGHLARQSKHIDKTMSYGYRTKDFYGEPSTELAGYGGSNVPNQCVYSSHPQNRNDSLMRGDART